MFRETTSDGYFPVVQGAQFVAVRQSGQRKLQHDHPGLCMLFALGVAGRAKMGFQSLPVAHVDARAIHGEQTKIAKHQQRPMLLLELFAEYDDQVHPEGNRQPASCFDECFFAQLGGIVAFGMMLALGRLFLPLSCFCRCPFLFSLPSLVE